MTSLVGNTILLRFLCIMKYFNQSTTGKRDLDRLTESLRSLRKSELSSAISEAMEELGGQLYQFFLMQGLRGRGHISFQFG